MGNAEADRSEILGRPLLLRPAWPGHLGKSDAAQQFRRGNGVGMHAQGETGNTGSPTWRLCVRVDRHLARDRPGCVGWRRGS